MEEKDVKNQIIDHDKLEHTLDLGDPKIFVAYPYAFDQIAAYRQKFLELEKRLNVNFLFADRELTGQVLLFKIAQQILKSCAAIFDLSMWNPNVLAELGIALGLDRKTFIFYNPAYTQDQDVPSDFRGVDRVQYKTTDELPGAIQKCVFASLPDEVERVVRRVLNIFRLEITPERTCRYVNAFKHRDYKVRELVRHVAKGEPDWYRSDAESKKWSELAIKMYNIFHARQPENDGVRDARAARLQRDYESIGKIDSNIDECLDSLEYSATYGDYLLPLSL